MSESVGYMMKFLLLVLIYITHYTLADIIVALPNGKIAGYEKKTPSGKIFHAFQGIPFGKSPVGNLRFQAPLPVDKWTGILKTQTEKGSCFSQGRNITTDTEDCLYLNVYTPVISNKNHSKIPVMFYIHGGGFRGGSGGYGSYGPDYLLEHGVIIVETNYRTGPFGFLSTGDLIVPGNAGMKDMVLALKWVNQNIALFGGDPKQVTIFGQSAGGAAVGLLIVSKAAAGLFRGGIAESGSGISNWAIQSNPEIYAREMFNKVTKKTTNSSTEILKVLQSTPASEIHKFSAEMTFEKDALPVLEKLHTGAFLTKSMYESLETGDFNRVPLFIGANSEEYISLANDMESLESRATGYEHNPGGLAPPSFNIRDTKKLIEVGHEIKKIYIPNGSTWQSQLGRAIAYRSESHFFNPCVRHAEMQSGYTDVYFYKFSYAGKMGRNKFHHLEGAELCTHGEELNYYFKNSETADLKKFPAEDIMTHKRMVKWWTNFAKYLNPTPEKSTLFQNLLWPKVKPNNFQYIDIDKVLSIKSEVKNGRYLLWKQLFDKYAVKPHISF